jgi:hypothetical protein
MLNPFASPEANDSGQLALGSMLESRGARMAEIGLAFVAWEKLRVVYNLVLGLAALIAVLVVDASLLLDLDSLERMAAAAVAANACFFAGHVVDCYATWLFGRLPWVRPVLFALGTVGSVLVTLAVISEIVLGDFLAAN